MSISERPKGIREEYGHLEMNTVVGGKGNKSMLIRKLGIAYLAKSLRCNFPYIRVRGFMIDIKVQNTV